eukprot:6301590-Amphidinium_carterae.1
MHEGQCRNLWFSRLHVGTSEQLSLARGGQAKASGADAAHLSLLASPGATAYSPQVASPSAGATNLPVLAKSFSPCPGSGAWDNLAAPAAKSAPPPKSTAIIPSQPVEELREDGGLSHVYVR